jgi:AcrR family transcriptional regulator
MTMDTPKDDRRSLRTKRTLHEALMSLMLEKRYDDITVQDILDRADVGRSTFYAHYKDKDDLMISNFMRLMDYLEGAVAQTSGETLRLLPTRELFEHVQENHQLFRAVINGRGLELFIEKGQEYWSQKIAADLQRRLPPGQQPAVAIPVMAQFVAGTLVGMLLWWLNKKMPYTPAEMDSMLEKLIMPGILNNLVSQPKGE